MQDRNRERESENIATKGLKTKKPQLEDKQTESSEKFSSECAGVCDRRVITSSHYTIVDNCTTEAAVAVADAAASSKAGTTVFVLERLSAQAISNRTQPEPLWSAGRVTPAWRDFAIKQRKLSPTWAVSITA